MNPLERLLEKLEIAGGWEKKLVLNRNDFLSQGGSINTNLYYIIEGSMRIFVMDELEEHTIRFGYAGNIITALDSYITEQASDFYIQALKKTTLKVISKKSFLNFKDNDAENRQLWDQLLQFLILQQLERERDILTSSPQERYNRVAKRSPQLFQEIPHKYIASYLRMTPETLSRIKKS